MDSYLAKVAARIRREIPTPNPAHERYLEGSGELLGLLYRMLGAKPPRMDPPEQAYVEHVLQSWSERDYADRWACRTVVVASAQQMLGQNVLESALG